MADQDPQDPSPSDFADLPEPPELTLGEPWAIAHDCELVREHTDGQLLCCAVIACGKCDTSFRIDLLDSRPKGCPNCDEKYTHVLLVSHVDNLDIAPQAFEQIARMNGFGQGEEAESESDESESDPSSDT